MKPQKKSKNQKKKKKNILIYRNNHEMIFSKIPIGIYFIGG